MESYNEKNNILHFFQSAGHIAGSLAECIPINSRLLGCAGPPSPAQYRPRASSEKLGSFLRKFASRVGELVSAHC
jgi:hypothetical protein